MQIVYVRTVYIARINRRVRPVGDGLVAAMAHLWSKFTKCLRPSKGASDLGPLPSPNVVPPSAQCRVIRHYYVVVITISRKRDPSSFHLSFALLPNFFSLRHVYICISSVRDLPTNLKAFPLNEYSVDNKIFPTWIIDAMYCLLFMGMPR